MAQCERHGTGPVAANEQPRVDEPMSLPVVYSKIESQRESTGLGKERHWLPFS